MKLLLLLALHAPSATGDDPVIDAARRYFAEARAISEADGGEFWGIPLDGPFLFVDLVERRILANRQVREGDALEEHDGVFVGPYRRGIMPANAAQDWAGRRWTTVLWATIPQGSYRRRALFAHEMFHRIQPELGHPATSPPCSHLDREDGRLGLRLELRALAEALLHEGDRREQAIADALLFRAARRARFEGAAEAERIAELNEGLAEYTGIRLSTLPPSAQPAWLARRIVDDEAAEGSDPIWMMRRMSGERSTAGFARHFAYLTGPAYGMLLDDEHPDWREQLDLGTDLADRLAEQFDWEAPEDLAAAAALRESLYDGWLVRADERDRRESRERQRDHYRQRLVDGPVLLLPLTGRRQLSFKTPELVSLPGIGRVYQTLEASSDWGFLVVEQGGALSHLDESGNPADLVVSAPEDIEARPLVGEGWRLELDPAWTVQAGAREGDWKLVRRD